MKIAIASGKGGTGKTTLSVNFASLIAESNNSSVILVDLDVEEPNSGLFLKGSKIKEEDKFKKVPQWNEDACTLCGLCKTNCNFNAIAELPKMILVFPELCHSCYACSELCPTQALPMVDVKIGVLSHYTINKNFEFIEGILDVGQESAVPLIKEVKQYLNENATEESFIIYDAPPGTSCPVIEATKDVDYVILVTEPTPFGFHDLKLAIATMQKMKKDFGVVINRHGIGNDEVEEHCLQNNIPLLGKIPHLKEAAKLYSEGKLLYNEIPEIKTELYKIYLSVKKHNNK